MSAQVGDQEPSACSEQARTEVMSKEQISEKIKFWRQQWIIDFITRDRVIGEIPESSQNNPPIALDQTALVQFQPGTIQQPQITQSQSEGACPALSRFPNSNPLHQQTLRPQLQLEWYTTDWVLYSDVILEDIHQLFEEPVQSESGTDPEFDPHAHFNVDEAPLSDVHLKYEHAWLTDCKEEKEIYLREAVEFQKIGRNFNAEYFDVDGNKLVPTNPHYAVEEKFCVALEPHMPHFKLLLMGARVEDKPEGKDESSIPGQQAKSIGPWFTQALLKDDELSQPNINELKATIEHVPYDDEPDLMEATRQIVYTEVHCDSFIDIDILDLPSDLSLSPRDQQRLSQYPEPVRFQAAENAQKSSHQVLLTLTFDPSLTIKHRITTGSPVWAKYWTAHVKDKRKSPQQTQIVVLLKGRSTTEWQLRLLRDCLLLHKSPNRRPLKEFHAPGKREIYTDSRLCHMPLKVYEDLYDYQPRTNFVDMRHYCTVNGISVLSDQLKTERDARIFCDKQHSLKLVKVAGTNGAYAGYIPLLADNEVKLPKGTRLRINFGKPSEDQDDEIWSAEVASHRLALGPWEYAKLVVTRRWDKRANPPAWSTFKPSFVRTDQSLGNLPLDIERDAGNPVFVTILVEKKVKQLLMSAIEDLNFEAPHNKRTNWNNQIEIALLGNNLDQLEDKDIFQAVRTVGMEADLKLNDGQRKAVLGAKHCPGGLLLIEAPPGTGMSHTMIQMARPFMQHKNNHVLLVLAPTNKAVNTLVQSFDNVLETYQRNGAPVDRYAIRIHSESTENAIRGAELTRGRTRRPDARPHLMEAIMNFEELSHQMKLLHTGFRAETSRPFTGIRDRRVAFPQWSVGHRMLEISGFLPGPLTAPEASKDPHFRDFNQGMEDIVHGRELDKKKFGDLLRYMWQYVLQHATVIVTTPIQGGMPRVLNSIKELVRVVFVSEAAYTREVDLLPYFAARFTKLDGMVLAGDPRQLGPPCMSQKSENLFAGQTSNSLLHRMLSNGQPSYMLTEQHRMIPQLLEISNALVYNKQLTSTGSVRLENRQMALAFGKMAAGIVGHKTNRIMVNVPSSRANSTHLDSTQSRFNDLFIILVAEWILTLLKVHKDASIAVITGYAAQQKRLCLVVSEMTCQGVEGIDRVSIVTMDAAIGETYDYVIMDILVTDDPPSLGHQQDMARINVATSRARNGFVLILDVEAVRACRYSTRHTVARLINVMRDDNKTEKRYDRLPRSPYYLP